MGELVNNVVMWRNPQGMRERDCLHSYRRRSWGSDWGWLLHRHYRGWCLAILASSLCNIDIVAIIPRHFIWETMPPRRTMDQIHICHLGEAALCALIHSDREHSIEQLCDLMPRIALQPDPAGKLSKH